MLTMWMVLAQGSSVEEFEACRPSIEELPKGTRIRLTVETPWYIPIAPLADLFFAEIMASWFIDETGCAITDVEGIGANTIIVHMEADPGWVIPLILAIAVIVGGIAIIISVIKLEADVPAMFRWGSYAVIAASTALGLAIIYKLFRR